MSVLKKTLVAAAALAFVSAPVAASAAPAKKLTVSAARVAAPVSAEKSNKAFSATMLAALAIAAALTVAVVANNGNSTSP